MAALVIGNAEYPDAGKLVNPVNDAKDVAAKLKQYGFDVLVVTDCDVAEMDKQLKEFRKLLDTHAVGLFFFAGHGMQIDGINYLLALNTKLASESDAKYSSLPLDKVVDQMAKSQASTKIIILDACRNNPWERAWQRSPALRGLASVYAPKGTIIGFATSPGEFASDGAGRNGAYTAALLQHIDLPDCPIETMFKRVRNTVAAATGGKQTSWEHTSLSGDFIFNLSLGRIVDAYGQTALADRYFVLDETVPGHKIIAGLKSLTWGVQNSALVGLNPVLANAMTKDTLFVLGRNILQAAGGSAHVALGVLRDFMSKTRGYSHEARKALLDGMLFEVFFDSKGERRERLKGGPLFDELFELQQHADLRDSFDFIAETLLAAGGDFYVVPGKGHELAATVSTNTDNGQLFVNAIYVGGANVLRAEDGTWGNVSAAQNFYSMEATHLNRTLSEQLVVPERLLKVTYTPASSASADDLQIPWGWTVRKG